MSSQALPELCPALTTAAHNYQLPLTRIIPLFNILLLSFPNMANAAPLRVGYVPEHFSTPLYFAAKHFGLTAELIPFPSGTGHMITSLREGEIDIGIGLTEGWVAGLGKDDIEGDGGYRIVGTYVETPLCTPLSPISTNRLEFWD
jgi:hypothetical protein